tara:strand:- start:434 stop:1066 length:633 start_codon:yes stop_codon:yes gene_type:complete
MTNFGDMTQIEFSDALASSNPTPGGGSAAAVALSQSAALTLMVSELTIGRDKWSSGWGAAENAKDIASPLINHGFILADKDSEAFNQVMKSFKLPKDTEEQKKLRSEAIHNATLEASNVPLETAKSALELLLTHEELAKFGNANAVTDVGVASLLASAACKGALFNVEINANSLPNDISSNLLKIVNEIRENASETSKSVMKEVYTRLEN